MNTTGTEILPLAEPARIFTARRRCCREWLPVICVAFVTSCAPDTDRLQFVEARRQTLPSGFAPEFVAVSPLGSVALLSTIASKAVVATSDTLWQVELPSGRPVGIRFPDDEPTSLEVIYADVPSVHRHWADGRHSVNFLQPPVELIAGTAAPRGWFVGGYSEGVLELYWLASGSWHYVTGIALRPEEGRQFFLGNHDASGILTWAHRPYAFVVFDTTGEVSAQRPSDLRLNKPLSRIERGVGFPVVLVDSLAVQSVADVQRGTYWLVASDHTGVIARTTQLPGPLVLLAAVPTLQQVVATSSISGVNHLIFYRWRWLAES